MREVAGAVDHIGLAPDDRLDQARVVLGVVLEIGVLDDHDLAARLRQRGADRRPLAAVPLVEAGPDRQAGGELGQDLARAVARAVVHHDDLLVDRHRQHAPQQRFQGGVLVVNRDEDGKERGTQDGPRIRVAARGAADTAPGNDVGRTRRSDTGTPNGRTMLAQGPTPLKTRAPGAGAW